MTPYKNVDPHKHTLKFLKAQGLLTYHITPNGPMWSPTHGPIWSLMVLYGFAIDHLMVLYGSFWSLIVPL